MFENKASYSFWHHFFGEQVSFQGKNNILPEELIYFNAMHFMNYQLISGNIL
jgi:hypothetical protein